MRSWCVTIRSRACANTNTHFSAATPFASCCASAVTRSCNAGEFAELGFGHLRPFGAGVRAGAIAFIRASTLAVLHAPTHIERRTPSRRRPMTPQERELVTALFDRLASLENHPRDPEAERLIAQGLAKAPHALYPLVQ